MSKLMSDCQIEKVGRSRAGTARFWCTAHGANATGRYGIKLSRCESAYRHIDPASVMPIDPKKYPGGLAVWAALPPVFDTSEIADVQGIHVHAREEPEGKKDIDGSFPAVSIAYRRDLLETGQAVITNEAGIAYYLSRFTGKSITCLFCAYCGQPHLDADYFAIKPHRRHLCHACGRYFQVENRSVSNPIATLRLQHGFHQEEFCPLPSSKALDISQKDYPGGIQIWASNPAVFWFRDKPEESGIHLHAYDCHGCRVEDDTFGTVRIDGWDLPKDQVAYLMAQRALTFLKDKIVALRCPSCDGEIFDKGDLAFKPHRHHNCDACGVDFETPGKKKLVVSNPLVSTLDQLKREGQK